MDSKLARLRGRFEKAQRDLKQAEAKADTRRKLILADALLKAVKDGGLQQSQVDALLNKYVTAKSQRELLGLEPLTKNNAGNGAVKTAPDPSQTLEALEEMLEQEQPEHQLGHQPEHHEYHHN